MLTGEKLRACNVFNFVSLIQLLFDFDGKIPLAIAVLLFQFHHGYHSKGTLLLLHFIFFTKSRTTLSFTFYVSLSTSRIACGVSTVDY